jgi:hypothetical protein
MTEILGFEEDDEDEVVDVYLTCECGAVATFRRVSVDLSDDAEAKCAPKGKWLYRVVHGGKK